MRVSKLATCYLAALVALVLCSCGETEQNGGSASDTGEAAIGLETEGSGSVAEHASGGAAIDEEPDQHLVEEGHAELQPQLLEQPEQQVSEAEQKHLAATCFVSWAGECYHENPTCDELGGDHNLIEMTIGEAIDAGYEPCRWCTY